MKKESTKFSLILSQILLFLSLSNIDVFACKQTIVKTFNVNNYLNTKLPIQIGDKITVKASGTVFFGLSAGEGDPTGAQNWCYQGYYDDSGDGYDCKEHPYNYSQDVRHGGLLGRIKVLSTKSTWYNDNIYWGKGATLTADVAGILEFNVNDNDPSNNKGFFKVDVEVCKMQTGADDSAIVITQTNNDVSNARKILSEISILYKKIPLSNKADELYPYMDNVRTAIGTFGEKISDETLKVRFGPLLNFVIDCSFLSLDDRGKINTQTTLEKIMLKSAIEGNNLEGYSPKERFNKCYADANLRISSMNKELNLLDKK